LSKTIVTITVDTEFSTHKDDLGVFGKINGVEYGVPKFIDLLKFHGMKATFFVDVYTKKTEYEPEFKKICLKLIELGHDVQLHTHPDGMFDPKRGAMKDYSLSEQIEIIAKGKQLFKKWFGYGPSLHRAGDWGANLDTLEALKFNDILTDSSMFYGWPNCLLNEDSYAKNKMVRQEGMLQIPASVYQCVTLGLFKPYRLISTDGNSFTETWSMIELLRKKQVPVINLVYHSFSFLKWNKERTSYRVAKNRLNKFDRLLTKLSKDQNYEVRTIKEIQELCNNQGNDLMDHSDYVPKSHIGHTLLRLADRLVD